MSDDPPLNVDINKTTNLLSLISKGILDNFEPYVPPINARNPPGNRTQIYKYIDISMEKIDDLLKKAD